MPKTTDLEAARASIAGLATAATSAAAALVELSAGDVLPGILEKAMEPQPQTFSAVLRAVAGFDFIGKFAGFLASEAGEAIEPGTAANLTALAAQLDPARLALANMAQAFDDAVAQVMAANQQPPGEEGHG